MISIKDKHNCCGCEACVQRCPKQCISLKEDDEGFLYPVADASVCIECGMCEKVCPVLNQDVTRTPLQAFAATNPNDDIRIKSSSGGIFSIIAEKIIEEGGVAFGAKFDDKWRVVHSFTETKAGLEAFRGSKYVQSHIGESYQKVEKFIKQGRTVLFSGTPCQISGLNKYLKNDSPNLITVEVVCHGVPSPSVWESFLSQINPQKKSISEINLRSKKRGWSRYSYLIKAGDETLFDNYASESEYLQAFSLNLSLRPSCYRCPAKGLKSGADITLADCWGGEAKQGINNDDNGISAVLVNTKRGAQLFDSINVKRYNIDYDFVKAHNISIVASPKEPYCRKMFWRSFPKYGVNSVIIVRNKLSHNLLFRLYNKVITNLTQ